MFLSFTGTEVPAGLIRFLGYKDGGQLWVECETNHSEAKVCGAFSVSAQVLEYEMMDVDSPDFYAVITKARLREISITSTPAMVRHIERGVLRYPQNLPLRTALATKHPPINTTKATAQQSLKRRTAGAVLDGWRPLLPGLA